MATTAPETTLCTFRKRFLSESEALFVQVLSIARQMKLLKLGTVALGGTKDPGRNYLVNTEGVPERRLQGAFGRQSRAGLLPRNATPQRPLRAAGCRDNFGQGPKLHANASRHSALSYDHVQKIEAQLQVEVQELLAMTWNIRRMAPLRALARG